MRKLFYSAISLTAAAAFATPALAQPPRYHDYAYAPATQREAGTAVAVGSGVVGGTVFGLGTSEGWWGSAIAGAALPTTVAGAAALGGVAGIGTAALVDAALEPCRGFAAMFDLSHGECVNGEYVGHAPPPHRAVRHRYRR